jgi:lipopolysaccharide transport system ATP-binding protein
MSTVIKIENLSKQYRLGLVGSGTLQDDFTRWWANIRGEEDPFLKIGEINDKSIKGESDYVWSLKDINFEVQHGEVLGIIGKNGAGKSTLLKILSKVTAPTTGSVKIKGRIASLLEVGTGFHPELTGRENIFLNGAILGMKRQEITNKLDEIIDFSGVERYIDTPVKRYSSGMYVRLAFAVAAHLESEILIIDEVLAVGDAEFQKKCLGKMKDISQGEGRTVLFVSHNMASINDLCTRCIYIKDGQLIHDGIPPIIIKTFLENNSILKNKTELKFTRDNKEYGKRLIINKLELAKPNFYYKDYIEFNFSIKKMDPLINEIQFGFGIDGANGIRICTYESKNSYSFGENDHISINVKLTQPLFVPSTYYISLGIRSNLTTLDYVEHIMSYEILDVDKNGNHFGFTLGAANSGYIDTDTVVKLL